MKFGHKIRLKQKLGLEEGAGASQSSAGAPQTPTKAQQQQQQQQQPGAAPGTPQGGLQVALPSPYGYNGYHGYQPTPPGYPGIAGAMPMPMPMGGGKSYGPLVAEMEHAVQRTQVRDRTSGSVRFNK